MLRRPIGAFITSYKQPFDKDIMGRLWVTTKITKRCTKEISSCTVYMVIKHIITLMLRKPIGAPTTLQAAVVHYKAIMGRPWATTKITKGYQGNQEFYYSYGEQAIYNADAT